MPNHGGVRPGAGRKKGTGPYSESTQVIRVPVSMIESVQQFVANKVKYHLPLFLSAVKAGFPSPADDFIEKKLDLNEHIIKHPAATYFVRVSGHSMIKAGIQDGDLLVVDRSIEPTPGKIVIAAIDGHLTVKRLKKHKGNVYLVAENEDFKPIKLTAEHDVLIWGVVIYVLHKT